MVCVRVIAIEALAGVGVCAGQAAVEGGFFYVEGVAVFDGGVEVDGRAVDEQGDGEAAGGVGRDEADGGQCVADGGGGAFGFFIADVVAFFEQGIRRDGLSVFLQVETGGRDLVFGAAIVDDEGGVELADAEDGREGGRRSGLVVEVVAAGDGLGERGRLAVPLDGGEELEGGFAAVSPVGDLCAGRRQAGGLQGFSDRGRQVVLDGVAVLEQRIFLRWYGFAVFLDEGGKLGFPAVEIEDGAGRRQILECVVEPDRRRGAVLPRSDADVGAVADFRVEGGGGAVHGDGGEGAEGAGVGALTAVDGDDEAEAGASVEFPQGEPGGEQRVGDGERVEVEEAVFLVVDVDGEEVQGGHGRDLQDAERGDGIGGVEDLRDVFDAVDVLGLADGDAVGGHLQGLGHAGGQHGREGAAADEHDGLRGLPVQALDLARDGAGDAADLRQDGLEDLFGGELVVAAEDVVEADGLAA